MGRWPFALSAIAIISMILLAIVWLKSNEEIRVNDKLVNNQNLQKNSSENARDNSSAKKNINVNQAKGWKIYRNNDYGFEFSYPERFGEAKLEILPEVFTPDGEKVGEEMRGTFTNIPSTGIIFGGVTINYDDASRSYSRVNFSGYIKNDEGYFFGLNRYTGSPLRSMVPEKIINNLVLFVDCKSFGGICDIPDSSYQGILGTKNEMAGLINLERSEYKGLIIWADKGYIQDEEFEKILSSVKTFK